MKKTKTWWKLIAGPIILAFTLAACAGPQVSAKPDTVQLLTEAGFKQFVAKDPKQTECVQSLPHKQMCIASRAGKPRYIYTDRANNRLYVGDEQAYLRYRDLAIQQRVEESEFKVQKDLEQDFDWGLWQMQEGAG